MKIAVFKEETLGEKRVPIVPATVEKLVKAGIEVSVQAGMGLTCHFSDEDYEKAGAELVSDPASLSSAEIFLRLSKPKLSQIRSLKRGVLHISYLDPFNSKELLQALAEAGVSALSLEMIPRTTLAQKMDVLSSQASLAGYAAVMLAVSKIDKTLPMMTTPAGTIKPARVFIVGAGVAGLQAIATAKRLGAIVEAFDTRPVVEEQVRSLGAKFLKIDLGETEQTAGGYAKELSKDQLEKQRQGMKKACANADIIITTAQVFGRQAPRIITRDMIGGMKAGSVIVDMAVESGGNVEGSEAGKDVEINGVTLVGPTFLTNQTARDASFMFSSNFANLILHFWDAKTKTFSLKLDDEIIKNTLIIHEGKIIHERFQ